MALYQNISLIKVIWCTKSRVDRQQETSGEFIPTENECQPTVYDILARWDTILQGIYTSKVSTTVTEIRGNFSTAFARNTTNFIHIPEDIVSMPY